MIKGTTPTYIFTTDQAIDLTQATGVYVTFSDIEEKVLFTKTDDALEIAPKTVSVFLTQEETLGLPTGKIKAQINWTYTENGTVMRAASEKMFINTTTNLLNEVL